MGQVNTHRLVCEIFHEKAAAGQTIDPEAGNRIPVDNQISATTRFEEQ
jgi:hypothetical protein